MARPHFKSQPAAIVCGLAAFGLGWFCLYDAYNGRGQDQPWPLKIISWW